MNTGTKVGAVLLSGYLKKSVLKKAVLEIQNCDPLAQIILVIDSGGGDTAPAFRFVEWMMKFKKERQLTVVAKVYNAGSAAAGIALAADEREMDRDGIFEIHIGSITIESNEIFEGNRIARRLVEPVRKWQDMLHERLAVVSPGIPAHLTTKLHATNRLRLSPDECLKYGIVQKLF